jgi:hypothetical protein
VEPLYLQAGLVVILPDMLEDGVETLYLKAGLVVILPDML